MESASAYAEDKTMIYLNFVAFGQCPSVGQGVGVDRSYILESAWSSEALLLHFLALLGLEQIPTASVRLNLEVFDIQGLKRMATICGDHAKLVESLLALKESRFQVFVAQNLVTRSSRDSSPNGVVMPPGTQCKPGLVKRLALSSATGR